MRLMSLMACLASSALPGDPAALQIKLQQEYDAILTDYAINRSLGAYIGIRSADMSFGFATGFSCVASLSDGNCGADGANNTRAKSSDLIPAGSITKTWTAAALLRLMDKGVLYNTMKVAPLVNRWLEEKNGTTLDKLWGGGNSSSPAAKHINEITIENLLQMNTGIHDYDDNAVWNISLGEPGRDITPFDYLHTVNKSFVCSPPGSINCMYYSSINFILAAMILAQYTNVSSWEQLDQRAATVPPSLVSRYNHTLFAGRGPCSQYANMTHTYAWNKKKDATGEYEYTDMWNHSCLNGWGFGNVAISTQDAASFYYDLLGPDSAIISGYAQYAMLRTIPLTAGLEGAWAPGTKYGLGVFDLGISNVGGSYQAYPYHHFIGHGGSDYGSYILAGYHPTLKIGVSVGMNKDYGSTHDNLNFVFCVVWKVIYHVLGNGTMPDGPRTVTC